MSTQIHLTQVFHTLTFQGGTSERNHPVDVNHKCPSSIVFQIFTFLQSIIRSKAEIYTGQIFQDITVQPDNHILLHFFCKYICKVESNIESTDTDLRFDVLKHLFDGLQNGLQNFITDFFDVLNHLSANNGLQNGQGNSKIGIGVRVGNG